MVYVSVYSPYGEYAYQCSNQYTACIVVLKLLKNQVETNERLRRALTYLNKFMLVEGGTSSPKLEDGARYKHLERYCSTISMQHHSV